jgi:hypothetical protein
MISSDDPFVTFIYNTSSGYPDIPAGGTGTNFDDFDFEVDPACPIGHIIDFSLVINSNEGSATDSFQIEVGRKGDLSGILLLLLSGN